MCSAAGPHQVTKPRCFSSDASRHQAEIRSPAYRGGSKLLSWRSAAQLICTSKLLKRNQGSLIRRCGGDFQSPFASLRSGRVSLEATRRRHRAQPRPASLQGVGRPAHQAARQNLALAIRLPGQSWASAGLHTQAFPTQIKFGRGCVPHG